MNRETIVEQALERIDPEIRRSLTPEQLAEIRKAIASAIPVPSKKIINLNVTIPFLVGRYYLAILIGRDRRKKRLAPPVERRSASFGRRKRLEAPRPEDLVAPPVVKRRWVPAWLYIAVLAAMRNPLFARAAGALRFGLDVIAVTSILLCLAAVALAFACFVIYSIKSTLGINVFPTEHFRDIVTRLFS